ncbi:Mak10 subunit, NatC N-terminal acetyltransferase-domain-containing protein [Desarmillaria tabescens]|uniref:Mak10 subunit, NatC N-terminal acetyltransferase-domain-containing protein n=1 Tax=Armillaria tabescens TaxID=1929756 RepID=A0AA39KF17_ARMTA|nr:Mak10 subunit, NatC N-terminal acetyltransferase-domain-containing protein [Desarmillaria tabescens]KAK0458604.1 Mak10 subunit, NatC N-terminal acetyltransferase-domain-containing protein [Desarmillaria tabescens]
MDSGPKGTDMPGGDAFQDVTDVFLNAAAEMEPGGLVMMEGFSLLDAMSALEIGEPRLDSGMIIEKNRRPQFDPLTPLLPEEVCWIIDRSFSYEMEWHAGNLLANTVFTLIYVHELGAIDPDVVPYQPLTGDPDRPVELLSVVLRTFVFGYLKCCGLAWDCLNRGILQDTEDWQGDKCDVSLLEGYPVKSALARLDEASNWLLHTMKIPPQWRDGLRVRLDLRKIILQLMDCNIYDDPGPFKDLLHRAHELLDIVRAHPAPVPQADSPAHFAFDPFIARRLTTFIPVREIDVISTTQTWDTLERLFHGWREMLSLSLTKHITTWEIVGNLRRWQSAQTPAYIRSRTQNCFYDGLLVLNRFTLSWLIQSFMAETLGTHYERMVQVIQDGWRGALPPPLAQMERSLAKLLNIHITGNWLNGPRRRRQLMNLAFDWHVFYDQLANLASHFASDPSPVYDVVKQLPNAALIWRLSSIREMILSGFQLELYAEEEKPFAYWYTSQVIEQQLCCIDAVLPVVPLGSNTYGELQFQKQFLTAIQIMSIAMFSVMGPLLPFDWKRMKPNFLRRYKWAWLPQYEDVCVPPVGHPELYKFLPSAQEISEDNFYSPSESFGFARGIISQLIESTLCNDWAGQWRDERRKFLRVLATTCDNLAGLPGSMRDVPSFNLKTLHWDPRHNPWFPSLLRERE